MTVVKTKSVEALEKKMQEVDPQSLRHHIMENAKQFKTSWIELGRSLYSVWKDKLYKEWGFSTFDNYSAKEVGIRKNTAMKLLRSYYFLEKEEPAYLKKEYTDSATASSLPSYEAVNVLRAAKGRKILDGKDYEDLKKNVFEKGKDAVEVKRDLTSLIRQREELEPEEAWEKKRFTTVKRLVGVLKTLRTELETTKLLPPDILKETEKLISKLEEEIQ